MPLGTTLAFGTCFGILSTIVVVVIVTTILKGTIQVGTDSNEVLKAHTFLEPRLFIIGDQGYIVAEKQIFYEIDVGENQNDISAGIVNLIATYYVFEKHL